MTYSSEVHEKGDPFSKLLEKTLLEKLISIVIFIIDSKTFSILSRAPIAKLSL